MILVVLHSHSESCRPFGRFAWARGSFLGFTRDGASIMLEIAKSLFSFTEQSRGRTEISLTDQVLSSAQANQGSIPSSAWGCVAFSVGVLAARMQ